jgi:hypothetical protein
MSRYRVFLAVALVALFLSGVDLYMFLTEYTAVTPRDWVTIFGVLLTPLVIGHLHRKEPVDAQLRRMMLWCVGYMALTVVWYVFRSSDVALQELRDRLLSVCFLCLAGFIMTSAESRRAGGIAAIVVVIVTVVMNLVQRVQPDWFLMGVSTRSSGLYGNANQCGAALVIGMIVGSQVLPRRLRLSFYLLAGVGVAMTFSRSTIVGWVIASTVLLAFDATRSRTRDYTIGALAAAMLAFALLQGAAASGFLDMSSLDDNLSDRVSFFKTLDVSDEAAQERKDVAAKAWEMFQAQPVVGNGLGSTVRWNERVSTHNMFLYFMADHGVAGALILPIMLACVFLGRPRSAPGSHWAFCMFTMWYAFFSHNIFTERYQLLAFAFFAMGGVAGSQAVQGQLARASRRLVPRPAPALDPSVAVAR